MIETIKEDEIIMNKSEEIYYDLHPAYAGKLTVLSFISYILYITFIKKNPEPKSPEDGEGEDYQTQLEGGR